MKVAQKYTLDIYIYILDTNTHKTEEQKQGYIRLSS